MKYKIRTFVFKRPSVFLPRKHKILKTVPKQSFVFSTRKYEIYLFIINLVSFLNRVDRWKFSHWFDWEPKLSYQQVTSILKDIYPGVHGLSRRSVRRFCCKTCISSGMSSKKMNELLMDVSSKRTHFFTVAFPAINHWFGLTSGECDEFSIIYVFIPFLWIMYIQSSIMFLVTFFIVKKNNK